MPVTGATQYTQCACQRSPTTAGPNDRAGFMLAPVTGPPINAQNPTVSPTAIAAKPAGARWSVATAMMTNMSAKHSSPLERECTA